MRSRMAAIQLVLCLIVGAVLFYYNNYYHYGGCSIQQQPHHPRIFDQESLVAVAATFIKWSVAQWLPEFFSISDSLTTSSWQQWEQQQQKIHWNDVTTTTTNPKSSTNEQQRHNNNNSHYILEIPTIDVQKEWDHPLEYLEKHYGKDWRQRPLLLKHLWTTTELSSPQRRISLSGLLQENMSIPYYYDSTIPRLLSPDAFGRIRDIVYNITQHHAPHKIGSQLLLQQYPHLIQEVAPTDFITKLFGNYFESRHIQSFGPFGIIPGLTTVPLFVAQSKNQQQQHEETTIKQHSQECHPTTRQPSSCINSSSSSSLLSTARTDLHCEPIGNVAVQLNGEKHWTLVLPEHSFRLRPRLAPDGRAFFASWATDDMIANNRIPQYHATTLAGDAMWVPTWTWHRVDYVVTTTTSSNNENEVEQQDQTKSSSSDSVVAIGASLFHFRVLDFWNNNPLFALLILPSLFKEIIGYNTQ